MRAHRTASVLGTLTAIAVVTGVGGFAATPGYAAAPGVTPVAWQRCTDMPPEAPVDCATVTVPIDWSKPHGATVGIAIARRRATDPAHRIGSILVDPGGPGGPGAEWVKGGPIFTPEINSRFDTVGFDPRGVGGSHPVLCDSDIEAQQVAPVPRTRAEYDGLVARNRALGESCRQLTGPLFDFVDTASVARDMDAIRAALGERKLNYYGVSYGTLMGQQYAELFPDHIRTMVIDSNMDHSVSTTWRFLQTEATAAQENFDQFVAWCARAATCALHGQDVRRVFADLLARADRGELTEPGSNFKIDQFTLLSIVVGSFYGPDWQNLAAFLAELASGQPANPAVAQQVKTLLATAGYGRPAVDPFGAVFCSDWRLPVHSFPELELYRRLLTYVAPDMKLSPLGWGATTGCIGWPARTTNPQHRLEVHGAPPILMLNSRYDPATPYQWATDAAAQMGAVLLTYDGWGHGAYFKGSTCVTGATATYFLTGKAPGRGTHCPGVEPTEPGNSARATPNAPGTPRFPLPGKPAWTG